MESENIDQAILEHPKRRAELTNFIADFLEIINLPKSSAKLKQEAQLKSCKTIDDFIRDVINDEQILEKDKSDMIREHLQKRFLKELSCSNVQQALRLMQNHFSAYFSQDEIQTFTTYFIEPPPIQEPFLNKLICQYVMSTEQERLPRFKKYYYQIRNQVWFVKSSALYTVMIDTQPNARIIKGDQILCDRLKIHEKEVSCVKWKNQHIFATGSDDAKVKIWNWRLICLRIINTHESQINGIAFSSTAMITGGRDNFMLVTKYDQRTKIQTCKLQITKILCKKMIDLLHLNKKDVSICLHLKTNHSVISFINLHQRKQVHYIKTENKVYTIVLSKDEQFLFANSSKAEIIMYSLQNFEIVRKLGGYFQQANVMRMEIGGRMNKYLAISSEKGQAVIYQIDTGILVHRIKSQVKSVANCVTWVSDSDLMMSFDNGFIEQYTSKECIPRELVNKSQIIKQRQMTNGVNYF